MRQRAAAEVQQLERLVEGRRVGRLRRADREQPVEVAGDDVGDELALAGAHPVAVALDGVDLAVVGDQPVGVRQRPAREGVGGEPRVHQRELGLEPAVGQVGEERLELPGGEHALVDEGATRQRREVDLGLALGPLAQAEGQPVQAEPDHPADGRGHEQLAEERHAVAGGLADELGGDRHVAPAEDGAAPPRRRSPRSGPRPRPARSRRRAGRRCPRHTRPGRGGRSRRPRAGTRRGPG